MITLQAMWGSVNLGISLAMSLLAIKTGNLVDRWLAGLSLALGVFILVMIR